MHTDIHWSISMYIICIIMHTIWLNSTNEILLFSKLGFVGKSTIHMQTDKYKLTFSIKDICLLLWLFIVSLSTKLMSSKFKFMAGRLCGLGLSDLVTVTLLYFVDIPILSMNLNNFLFYNIFIYLISHIIFQW